MILIIDDETLIGTQLRRFLRDHNLDATLIPNGIDALTSLHVRKPRLIILDLRLPGIDGLSFLRAIRHDPSFKNIPILVYTSEFSRDLESQAFAAGAQEFLIKGTISLETLLTRVRELLGEPTPAAPSPSNPDDPADPPAGIITPNP